MVTAHGNVAGLLSKHGYTELRKVGEGSFGKAILVQAADGSRLICKMVDVSKASRKEMQDAVKEGQLLAELKHPYIVRYRENFTENGWLCILMDYCEGGDLTKQIEETKKRRQTIAEEQVLKWFAQALMALKYIHDKHILHRDLKPSNFFLSKGGSMKMGDFGIAKVLACTIAVAKTQIGTPYYLSPELCQEKPYAWPSDIWSMGCILYEMCVLKVPFDAPNIAGLVQKIVRGPIPSIPNSYSGFVGQLCSQMLDRNPNSRPGSAEILDRPRIRSIVDQMIEEAQAANVTNVIGGSAPAAGPTSTPYERCAGTYKKGDLVEYYSASHKDWLPATVTNADESARIVIDLKPNTWIAKAEQAIKIRPRTKSVTDCPPARAASPMVRQSPSMQRSPSIGPADRGTPRGGGACPSPVAQRSPSVGPGPQPASRCASPMMNRSPSIGFGDRPSSSRPSEPAMHQRTPSVASVARPDAIAYRRGDLVEYYSMSHKDWLPAVVANLDSDGRIVIDLKPNTWLSKDEQAAKVRPRGRGASANRPASRGTPMVQRSPSVGALASGNHQARGMTPSRAPSPCRGSSRDRAESPFVRRDAGAGTPRMRPPGLPPGMPKASDSPLRQGGKCIAGI